MNYNQEYTIECELCGRVGRCSDEYDSPEVYFKNEGWEEDDGWTLCPHCAGKAVEE